MSLNSKLLIFFSLILFTFLLHTIYTQLLNSNFIYTFPSIKNLANNLDNIYQDVINRNIEKNLLWRKNNLTKIEKYDSIQNETRRNIHNFFTASRDLPWWDQDHLTVCRDKMNFTINEKKIRFNDSAEVIRNHCGFRSWLLGPHQKVISYSLYGEDPGYQAGLPSILEDAATLYPSWSVRLYTDPRGKGEYFCPLLLKHPHFVICDVTNLPHGIGDVTLTNPMMWRSTPMGDSQVDRFIVRDTDSKVEGKNLSTYGVHKFTIFHSGSYSVET